MAINRGSWSVLKYTLSCECKQTSNPATTSLVLLPDCLSGYDLRRERPWNLIKATSMKGFAKSHLGQCRWVQHRDSPIPRLHSPHLPRADCGCCRALLGFISLSYAAAAATKFQSSGGSPCDSIQRLCFYSANYPARHDPGIQHGR